MILRFWRPFEQGFKPCSNQSFSCCNCKSDYPKSNKDCPPVFCPKIHYSFYCHINSKKSEYNTKKQASEIIIKKISDLDTCPTCLQKITLDHAKQVNAREQVIIKACETNLDKLNEWDEKLNKKKI